MASIRRTGHGVAAALIISCLAPVHARAVEVPIRVSRSTEAVGCPDADAVARTVNAARARPARLVAGAAIEPSSEGGPLVDVAFSRPADSFRAYVRISGSQSGERALSDPSPTCVGLADALAVFLVVYMDAQLEQQPPAPRPEPEPRATEASLAAGTGMSDRVAGGWSPFLWLAGEMALPARLSLRLAGGWALPEEQGLGPGVVSLSLAWASLGVCWSVAGLAGRLRLALCGEPAVGRLSAHGSGYETNRSVARPWLGLLAGATVTAALARWVHADVGVRGVRSLRDEQFAIDGLGVASQSPELGLLTHAGVRMVF